MTAHPGASKMRPDRRSLLLRRRFAPCSRTLGFAVVLAFSLGALVSEIRHSFPPTAPLASLNPPTTPALVPARDGSPTAAATALTTPRRTTEKLVSGDGRRRDLPISQTERKASTVGPTAKKLVLGDHKIDLRADPGGRATKKKLVLGDRKKKDLPSQTEYKRGHKKVDLHVDPVTAVSHNESDRIQHAPESPLLFDRPPANDAVRREVDRHNRWVVEGLAYLHRFDSSKFMAEYQNITKAKLSSDEKKMSKKPPITIVVLAMNRAVPYLAVLTSMLLRGHTAETFLSRIDVHIVNVERREGKKEDFALFSSLKRTLPFLTFHDWTDPYDENAGLAAYDGTDWYLANQRLDYIRALRLCKEANSSWCIVLEDDGAPCINFTSKFEALVAGDALSLGGERVLPHKPKTQEGGATILVGAAKIGKGTTVSKNKIGKLKLYMPYNHGHGGGEDSSLRERDILNDDYARDGYWRDRVPDAWEVANATTTGKPAGRRVDYQLRYSTHAFGVVAEAYPAAVLGRLIGYLQKQSVKDADGHVRPLDVLVNLDFFRQEDLGLVQLEVSPSLVTHIGYVSEHAREMIPFRRISTDVRFVLGSETNNHSA